MSLKPVLQIRKSGASFAGAARLLMHDRQARRDLPRWTRSLLTRLRRAELGVERSPRPCITFGALDWLESTIQPSWRVFEWGSGASTLYYGDKGVEIVAVEHHREWAELVQRRLTERGSSGRVLHRPPEPGVTSISVTSVRPEFSGQNFDRYVGAIDEIEGEFDLIVVDGRARNACGERALPRLAPGGFMLLDNAERPRYEPLHQMLSHLERTDFSGLGPYSAAPWCTTIWRKPTGPTGRGPTA